MRNEAFGLMMIEMSQADSRELLKMTVSLTLLTVSGYHYDFRDTHHRQILVLGIKTQASMLPFKSPVIILDAVLKMKICIHI